MNRIPLVAGNWKMNNGIQDTIKFVAELTKNVLPESPEVLICPPFTSLYTLQIALDDNSKVKIGAQNCHFESEGAYTGEVSVEMLKEIPVDYVIVGHSERRHIFGETNEILNRKLHKVTDSGLTAIYCVGETLEEREAGDTIGVIQTQLDKGLKGLDRDHFKNIVLAYEPVWAIGTGKTATPEIAQEVHSFIRKWLNEMQGTLVGAETRILYGGSVKPGNIEDLIKQEDIDGALVGGASLNAEDFLTIISHCR